MSGKEIRVKKFFRNKKNLVITALDHVMFYGYQIGLEDAKKALHNCIDTDAIILSQYMLDHNPEIFSEVVSPIPIVRLNWSSSFYYPLDYREGNMTITTTVEDAVRAGAEYVICSLFLEEENAQSREAENITLFSRAVREKERLGIPLIGECYVVEHKDLTKEQLHDKVRRVTRIIAELGADFIKTFFTGDRFHEVVENTPVPLFTIGAEKLNTDIEVLKKADESVKQGARGIIFGRNIFMAKDPKKLIKAINLVINNGKDPEEAAQEFGLI